MEWQSPQFLYLILPLGLGWLWLALYSEKRRQKARESLIASAMQGRILPPASRSRFWIKLLLFEIAIATGLIALAEPRFGTRIEQVVPRGSDLYVLIDVSRSMLADDVIPSRLERAKADVSSLVNRLNGERIGLIAFAGKAVVKCPLTIDYDSFRRALMELDPTSAPRGGTAIGDAIRKAVEVFHAGTERDQAVLLITDGDDQESFPLEAATVAAERKVTVFTIGLGDASSGARVPGQTGSGSFVEHEGQQVWSKLNGSLLSEIALRTNGVYIPAGTRSYDLGELYTQHLQGRTGDKSQTQNRIRKSERYQIFLGFSLLALLIDLGISRYSKATATENKPTTSSTVRTNRKADSAKRQTTAAARGAISTGTQRSSGTLLLFIGINTVLVSETLKAGESHQQVRDGLKHYEAAEYDSAEKLFATAAEELDKKKSSEVAIAAFDEACALHRKGDQQKARERYLSAGLSSDKTISTAAHFNLGTLAAESARKIAGENPENVSPEDRQKILDELKQAVASYRHALELNPEHQQSRRNLELVRLWVKHYSDRWAEIDRQKRRDETSLIQFLEFLMTAQQELISAVQPLSESTSQDTLAQLRQRQDELANEIPFLREKIAKELSPQSAPPGSNSASTAMPSEVKEVVTLLQSWSDKAGELMQSASREIFKAKTSEAATHQQDAINQLDQIWDAVIQFQPLLARELVDQTSIAEQLMPLIETNGASEPSPSPTESTVPQEPDPATQTPDVNDTTNTPETSGGNNTSVASTPNFVPLSPEPGLEEPVIEELFRKQSIALRKARLLAPKAQAELDHLEATPPAVSSTPSAPSQDAATQDPQTAPGVDPEKIKQGLRKAIELSPKAVEAMEVSADRLERRDPAAAARSAEEARRILEEIQNAQPEEPQQNQDQQKQDHEKQDDSSQKNDDQQKQDQKNKDEKESSEQKQDSKDKQKQDEQKENSQNKKNEDKQKQDDQKKEGQQKQDSEKSDNKKQDSKDKTKSSGTESQQPAVSSDRIEEALRKVRERQQVKRERDREVRARVLGRTPVEKDW